MVLRVPTEYPLVQISAFNWNQPPYVPAIPIPQQVERARSLIAAALANEAGAKATQSSARMYCYNLFVENNWNNQSFAEMVKLIADYLALQVSKNLVQNLDAAVVEATSNLLTLQVSFLIVMTPELKSIIHPSALNAAMQNVPQLENLKKEILQMYHHNGMPIGMHPQQMQQMQMQHGGMMYHSGGVPMHGGQMYPGQPPQQVQGPHAGQSGFSGGGVPSGGFMEGSFDEGDRFATRRAAQVQNDPQHHQQVQMHQQQQHPQQTQYHSTSYHHNTTAQPMQVDAVPTKPTELTIPEGTEMDRAKHQLSYFGGVVTQDLTPRMEMFQKTAQELSVANVDDAGPLKAHWNAVLSLEEAIALGRVNHQKQMAEKGTQALSREFVIQATPIIVGADMKQYWDSIRSATSFVGMAKKMQVISMALEETKNPENADQAASILNLLSTIDVRMTDVINKFLSINLGLAKVSIDSFVGDVEGIGQYLHKKFGPMEAQAWSTFENEMYDVLLHEFDEQTSKDLLAFLEVSQGTDDYPLFPENYSITYLFLNSKELGYQVNDQPVRINARTFPSLHQIAQSLEAHKKAMEMSTIADLLVCSDGVKYRVYRDYRIQGEYLISAF